MRVSFFQGASVGLTPQGRRGVRADPPVNVVPTVPI